METYAYTMQRPFPPRTGISLLAVILASVSPCAALANPTGGAVSAGAADISSSGKTLTVNQSSDKAVIDWRGFDIAQGETTQFNQPGSSSITLNRVNSPSASFIDGTLKANGNVVIVNQNGVLFGRNAQVNVNSLIATTADIDNDRFMAGDMRFDKPGSPDAFVANEGMITAKQAGLVGLVAPNVLNSGVIRARLGRVELASGDTFTVDLYGDDLLSIAASPALQRQLVQNTGLLKADGGSIELTAAAAEETVNSLIDAGGRLEANAVGSRDGSITIYAEGSNAVPNNAAANKGQKTGTSTVLVTGNLSATSRTGTGGNITVAGDAVGIGATTFINASGATGGGNIKIGGDFHGEGLTPPALTTIIENNAFMVANATDRGNGGSVAVWSDGSTTFNGFIMAEGGPRGGNGGFVETSGHGQLIADGVVDLTAPQGGMGAWLLDPTNISIYGNFSPAFAGASSGISSGDSSYAGSLASNLQLWLDASSTGNVTLSYNSLGLTATGSAGSNTITVSSNSGLVIGERIQIGGTSGTQLASVNDTSGIYTITNIGGTTVTLDANLASAASGASVYGGYVSQINDRSGNGNNATQSTAANMPLWISNGRNGLGVAYFNNSNQMDVNLDFLVGSNYSFLGVDTRASSSGYNLYVAGSVNSTNKNFHFGYTPSNTFRLGQYGNDVDASLPAYVPGTAYIALGVYNASSGHSIAINSGLRTGSNTHLVGLTSASGEHIGDLSAYTGYLQEIAAYNAALSANAQSLVNQYEAAKWNVALTGPGSIGTETGLTGSEAQQAMASMQAGASADGYSVFSADYLNRLSQTSNIILQASNNINLDLQGATLTLAAGKNITLTAGNQIVTASAGGITTSQSSGSGGDITFTATNGIVFNQAFALNSGGGAIDMAGPVTLNAGLDINAGNGAATFGAAVNGTGNLTATAGTFSFAAGVGGTTPLGDVSLTSASTLTLPSVSAVSLLARTTGSAADLAIGSGDVLTASGTGTAVTLAAARNFVNNGGSSAISMTGGGRWLIYSTAPGADTFDNLDSGNTALWNETYGGTVTQAGNRYLFAWQPTVTFTSIDDSKTFGTDATAALAADYNISGLQTGVASAYLADTAATAFSGAPSVTSAGAPASASVSGSPYAITVAQGSLTAVDGYALTYNSSGLLMVNQAPPATISQIPNTVQVNMERPGTIGDSQPQPAGTYAAFDSDTAGLIAPPDGTAGLGGFSPSSLVILMSPALQQELGYGAPPTGGQYVPDLCAPGSSGCAWHDQ